MNVRNSEIFHESLLGQYRDMIREAIYESETDHKTRMDLGKLNAKLKLIYKAALYDGLSETTINEMIDQSLPECAEKAA